MEAPIPNEERLPNIASMTLELFTEDVDTTAAFYKDILGFTLRRISGAGTRHHAVLITNGIQLIISRTEEPLDLRPPVSLHFEVRDIDSLYERMLALHVIDKPLAQSLFNQSSFTVIDPTGATLRFVAASS